MTQPTVRVAESEVDLRRCFPVMQQLRPHLDEPRFLEMVARMHATDSFRIAYVQEDGEVMAVGGYRIMEMLFSNGRVLYVDDLVTDAAARSRGHGALLFEWLMAEARAAGCVALTLDSGVQRFDAHRFYFTQRMHVAGYHFRMEL